MHRAVSKLSGSVHKGRLLLQVGEVECPLLRQEQPGWEEQLEQQWEESLRQDKQWGDQHSPPPQHSSPPEQDSEEEDSDDDDDQGGLMIP